MQSTITFNKTGYDPFIDFIKAYSILVVIFCHGFPYLKETGYAIWGVQIPLFFLVQVFHCYKREPKNLNWGMIGRRIVLPFVAIEAIVFSVKLVSGGGQNLIQLLKTGIAGGGFGPGSYYPWVYLQMGILIPLMRPLCDKLGKWMSFFVFVLVCEAIEIICSLIDLPDAIYRLLCFRYVMLIWFGWMWVKEGIKINNGTIIASLVSLFVIIYLVYIGGNYEPWLYNTDWIDHRWLCYCWVSWLFATVLYKLYIYVCKYKMVVYLTQLVATASYEVFLIQMMYYSIVKTRYFSYIGNEHAQYLFFFVMAFVVSIVGGVWMLKLEKCIYKRKDRELNHAPRLL